MEETSLKAEEITTNLTSMGDQETNSGVPRTACLARLGCAADTSSLVREWEI